MSNCFFDDNNEADNLAFDIAEQLAYEDEIDEIDDDIDTISENEEADIDREYFGPITEVGFYKPQKVVKKIHSTKKSTYAKNKTAKKLKNRAINRERTDNEAQKFPDFCVSYTKYKYEIEWTTVNKKGVCAEHTDFKMRRINRMKDACSYCYSEYVEFDHIKFVRKVAKDCCVYCGNALASTF